MDILDIWMDRWNDDRINGWIDEWIDGMIIG